jgi:hypothetical protein
MLLDTIAIVILAGMMLVPVINIIVGIVVGAGLGGAAGASAGFVLALAVTVAERLAVGWLYGTEAVAKPAAAVDAAFAEVLAIAMPVRQAAATLAKVRVAAIPVMSRDDDLLDMPPFAGGVGRPAPAVTASAQF